ncbi:MAG: NifB/NifX family molybdenum-iron cluster-binding protein [Sedimentibacter sp.]
MRIALPAENKSMDANIYQSFGRTPYILLYNTITKESEFLDNSAVVMQGGAGIRVAQVVADNGAKTLITLRCGENAEKVLSSAEVLIYKAIPGTVQQNIDKFISEELHLLNEFHEGFHGNEE